MSVRFGDFELDFEARELRRAGEAVHLAPKAYSLLELLAREQPRAVAKEQILDTLWPGTFVADGSISVAVAEVRRALGDSGQEERYVRTVRGFGYAFCALPADEPTSRPSPNAVCRLVAWGIEQHWLSPGEHLIGRDKACDVAIDAAGLSRRHARLRIGAREATLQDLESKNGSFINAKRLAPAESQPVHEGDEIRLGSIVFSLHWLAADRPTETLSHAARLGPAG